MVYYGPSRGCSNCRARRVRCDLQQPACARCVKRKEECSGPRTDEAIRAERAANSDRIVKRDMHYAESILVFDASDELRDDPAALARSFYMNTYSQTGLDSFFHGGLVTGPWETMSQEVSLATDVLAFELFCYWHRVSTESRAFQTALGRTLSTLRTLVSDPASARKDEALATALMLQSREKIGVVNSSQPSYHHLEGALALVRHRGLEDFQSKSSQNLLAAVRYNCLQRALRGDGYIDPEDELWQSPEITSDAIDGILDPFAFKIVLLQQSVADLEAGDEFGVGGPVLPTPASLLAQAMDLEAALYAWEDEQPRHTKPIALDSPSNIPTSVLQAGVFEGKCETYYDMHCAKMYSSYRFLHLCVYECMGKLEALMPEYEIDLVEMTAAYTRASELIDDLCASVPYYLGSRKGPNYITAFTETHRHHYPTLDSKRLAELVEVAKEEGATRPPLAKKENGKRLLSIGSYPLYSPIGIGLHVLKLETYAVIHGPHALHQQRYLQNALMRMMKGSSYYSATNDLSTDHNLILKHAGGRAFETCSEVHAMSYEPR